MKELKFLTLAMEHFKGQECLALDLFGRDMSIYGDNGTGKTTIFDAVTWLLFGTDSRGFQPGTDEFQIKPLDGENKVRDHAAITSVEAVIRVDSLQVTLKKTYSEKWSTKRGGSLESFDGNTTDYSVDGVPCKKYEYERRVAELVEEEVFRLLTRVTYFCSELDWRERRRVLFDVCGVASDRDIMALDPIFEPLMEGMGPRSLDDYKKKIQAERKGLNGVRSDVPTRLSECQKTEAELSGVDFQAIREKREVLVTQRDTLSSELLKLEHNSLLDTKRNERGAIQNELAKIENDNEAHRRTQVVNTSDDGSGMRREMADLKRGIIRWSGEKTAAQDMAENLSTKIQACRERWNEINARQFRGMSCPTCGNPLSGKKLEEAVSAFDHDKADRLRHIVEESGRLKELSAQEQERQEHCIDSIVGAENRIAALNMRLAALKPVEQPDIADLPDYREKRTRLLDRLTTVERDISGLKGESASIQAETRSRIQALTMELSGLDRELAKEGVLDYTHRRMETLQEEARRTAEALEKLDRVLALCEEFTRFKVRFVEDTINSRFGLAKFKLFSEQVNGGLADCCEVTCMGVPFGSLNNGARINVGIDVISTLSEHYGVRVPLFVDNAESVTRLYGIGTQLIRLVVSENDKELRCEYGT